MYTFTAEPSLKHYFARLRCWRETSKLPPPPKHTLFYTGLSIGMITYGLAAKLYANKVPLFCQFSLFYDEKKAYGK
jgi:hypothetical protein